MLTGSLPFQGESDYLTFQEILGHCDGSKPLAFPPSFPPPAKDLVLALLVRPAGERLGAGEPGQPNDPGALKVSVLRRYRCTAFVCGTKSSVGGYRP
jgi:3-phosphoinositide dependent protein kinase-1